MASDSAKVRELKEPDDVWGGAACFYEGVSVHLLGDPEAATELLREAIRRTALVSPVIQCLALSQIALIALDDGDLESAVRLLSEADGQVARCGIAEYPAMTLTFAASALVRATAGRPDRSRESLGKGLRLLAQLNGFPAWYETEARIALAEAAVRLDDLETARRLSDEAWVHFGLTSDAAVLGEHLDRLEAAVGERVNGRRHTASTLTTAELRTLQHLPTHLTFRQIGEINNVSANTVKTQARAIYRKLGVNSRAEAVEHARRDGLFEADQVKMI
jgi:LuxR family maltose regulon positive regulatory protein